jgi:hypothetical protein
METCPACGKTVLRLAPTKHLEDGRVPVCKSCAKRAANIAYRTKAKEQQGIPTPAPPAGPEVEGKGAEAPEFADCGPSPVDPDMKGSGFVPLAPRYATGGLYGIDTTPRGPFPTTLPVGRAVVLRFTCHEMADVRLLLEAGRGLSVAIGLEGTP